MSHADDAVLQQNTALFCFFTEKKTPGFTAHFYVMVLNINFRGNDTHSVICPGTFSRVGTELWTTSGLLLPEY